MKNKEFYIDYYKTKFKHDKYCRNMPGSCYDIGRKYDDISSIRKKSIMIFIYLILILGMVIILSNYIQFYIASKIIISTILVLLSTLIIFVKLNISKEKNIYKKYVEKFISDCETPEEKMKRERKEKLERILTKEK